MDRRYINIYLLLLLLHSYTKPVYAVNYFVPLNHFAVWLEGGLPLFLPRVKSSVVLFP